MTEELVETDFDAGTFLRQARTDLGLTQKEAAQKIAITVQTLQNWEAGRAGVKSYRFFAACVALGVEPPAELKQDFREWQINEGLVTPDEPAQADLTDDLLAELGLQPVQTEQVEWLNFKNNGQKNGKASLVTEQLNGLKPSDVCAGEMPNGACKPTIKPGQLVIFKRQLAWDGPGFYAIKVQVPGRETMQFVRFINKLKGRDDKFFVRATEVQTGNQDFIVDDFNGPVRLIGKALLD